MAITRDPSKNIIPKIRIGFYKKEGLCIKNKERIAEYHKNYYLIHKEELNRKHREYLRNRKNNKRVKHKIQMILNFGFNDQSYCV
jgi:hypothetical protein